MDTDIKNLYNQLQDKYSLELTSSFQQKFKTNIDYPILRGTTVWGRFDLFYGDLDFEFYAKRNNGEFMGHLHLKSIEEARQVVADFMEGKLTLISF